MEEKYLPIGSVCTLKGKNRKVMIIGYYSVNFNGNLKIDDYKGCFYPEGLLVDQTISFNHDDIETLDFLGFKNSDEEKFMNLFDKLTGNMSEEEKAKEFHEKNDMFLTSNSTYSKLLFDENGVVMLAEPVQKELKENKKDFSNINFDENGTVISVGDNSDVTNPFYKEYDDEPKSKEEKSNKWKIFNNIGFDKDGTVISTDINEKKDSMLSEIKFDENGTVISVGKEELEKAQDYSKYKFDENGILVSVDGESLEEEIPPIGPGLPGYEEPKKEESKYEFDENGVLVSEGETEEIPPIGPGLPGYEEPKKEESKYEFDENGTVVSAE